MAIGDAATAAGMDIVPGSAMANTIDTEINKTRDYLGTITQPIARGGTGATDAAAARVALDVVGNDQIVIADGQTTIRNKIPRYDDDGHIACASPIAANHAASKAYVDARPTGVPATGGTFTGQVAMPNLYAVASSYIVMYRNGDGRIGISPSARRFKKDIRTHAYTLDDALAIDVVDYRLRSSIYGSADAPVDVGVIAEQLLDIGLDEYVVFDNDGQPLSVHYERLALVALGALHDVANALDLLTQRITALEAGNADR